MDSTTQTQNEVKTDGQPGGAAKLIRQVRQAMVSGTSLANHIIPRPRARLSGFSGVSRSGFVFWYTARRKN